MLLTFGPFLLLGCNSGSTAPPPPPTASNQSTATQCAEEDNVNVPLRGNVPSFVVEATHPGYEVGQDNCDPDFTNCPDPQAGHAFTPGVYKLYDDGETVVEAVREASWWQPRGMSARVDDGDAETDIHFIRVYRKIAAAAEWPQFFVLYMDGNMRLIPHPPAGVASVCFGSSVIIGPAAVEARPIAEIASVKYVSATKTLEVAYRAGGSAVLDLTHVTRTEARVHVTVNYATDANPFVTFRSMFVAGGNADVDYVQWKDAGGTRHDDAVMAFTGGQGTEWFFHRKLRSTHNTSAPDIRIRLIE